ncbi:histone deacetylase [Sarracenia purpurea var. burkii]
MGAEGFCVNVPWSRGGVGDNDYLFAFHHVVLPIASEFAPDFTIISAGFDAARGDPLGCCDVTPAGYAQMTHMLNSLSGGKLLVILEGGYNLRSISSSAAAVIKVAAKLFKYHSELTSPPIMCIKQIEENGMNDYCMKRDLGGFENGRSKQSCPYELYKSSEASSQEFGKITLQINGFIPLFLVLIEREKLREEIKGRREEDREEV